ncbi:MAG: Acyl-CoA synthetase (AMP-forming)/AMP-acid ligase [Ilumatobacteraceae bacterium]|nr:Acyl-CoA synthetase (AMP-forming)/AMP-acid ligase [Ilumatobacteraceae bacterium]
MLLGEIIRLNGRKYPDRIALIDTAVEPDRVVTFGELRDRMLQVANAMLSIATPGDRVAILAENVPEYVEMYYGVPSAGMALTFLNYRLHPKEWAWILNNAAASVLVVQPKYLEMLEPLLGTLPSLKTIVVIGDAPGGHPTYADLVGAASAEEPDLVVDEDSTAWLLYTSGTTGFPKGAMLTHKNLVVAALNSVIEYAPQPDERVLMAFPLCHVSGYAVPVNHVRGGQIVLTPMFEPELFMRLVDQYQITGSAMAPTMLNMLLQHPMIDDYDLSSLRSIGYGAAAMPVEVLRAAIKRFGPIVYSGFGMTELGGNVLTFPKSAHERAVNGAEHLLASCGTPMCLADVKVVDEQMNECPPGVVGEIVIKGEQVLKGYFRNEEGTTKAFEHGWFHTGDMARRDDEGFFYIVDRMKDMIITGGENVYSREVEEVLYQHPAVSEAAVVGIPDVMWGEKVTAVIVLRSGMTATEAEIIAVSRDNLAGYKKPKSVVFIDEMPKTVSGKIIKRELRDRLTPSG